MKIIKGLFNFLGILAAFVLSIILVTVLTSIPLFSGAKSLTKPVNLRKMISEIDYAEMFAKEEFSEEDQWTVELMETEMAADLIGLYVEDVFNTLEGNVKEKRLTTDALKALTEEHMDELLSIMKEMIAGELSSENVAALPDAEIEKYIYQLIDTNGDQLLQSFPDMDDLGIDENVITVITYFREGFILYAMIGTAVVLSVLIFICRCVRFKGFIWLGIVYLFAAVINLVTALGLKGSGSVNMTSVIPVSEIPAGNVIVTPILNTMATEFYKNAGFMVIITIVCIIIYVLSKKAFGKNMQGSESVS